MEEICPLANTFVSREYLDELWASSHNHLWPLRSVNLLWKMAMSNKNVKRMISVTSVDGFTFLQSFGM